MTTRSIHTRAALDDGLAQLQADLRAMTSLLDVAIERSVLSLQTLDQRLARLVIDSDEQINRMRFQIEDRAIHLIATQQPIAGDLRFIVATLMVVSEIERMGDYAAGIAKVVQLHENRQLLKPLIDVPEMARLVREMLREAVDAFLRRNEHTAERVAFQDDEVDRLYDIVYRELLQYMANDPTTIDRATWLLWVAHNLERMGDRIQNICERTVYEVTGVMREFSSHVPRQSDADGCSSARAVPLHAQLGAIPDGRGVPQRARRRPVHGVQCRDPGARPPPVLDTGDGRGGDRHLASAVEDPGRVRRPALRPRHHRV